MNKVKTKTMKNNLKKPLLVCALSVFAFFSHGLMATNKQDENAKANALFEELFNAEVARSPIYQGYLGIKDNNDKWDDISLAAEKENLEFTKAQLKKLRGLDTKKLNDTTIISYKLYEKKLTDDIASDQWRHHNYPVNQMFGTHSMVPSFLINIHRVSEQKDLDAYILRLQKTDILFDQLIEGLAERKEKGIVPPTFVFDHVIRDSQNIISGAPFNKGEDSTLLADFKEKMASLTLSEQQQKHFSQRAEKALKVKVGPAYKKLISYLKNLEKVADTRDGVWKLPRGEAFYRHALKKTTTTELSADEIHTIGLKEVDRIHREMRSIMKKVKFQGTLQEFFTFMRDDEQFYYEQSESGKQQYLNEATKLIDDMKAQLDVLFIAKPKADLTVKAVEPFREKSAGKAFYQRPAPDGSRPGIYYANVYQMSNMPIYQMEALAYHEGIPGHHMQLSIAQEIEDMPTFRKFGSYTAYIEGWGLYSELLPKEFGFYKDPYSDFGRLAMELWRAARLVVDTGIHAKKWTRKQAIEYLVAITPNPKEDALKAIERYIVMPSQATAYKIGMLKILELRAKAKSALGDKYDIREFHEVVLNNGPVPLDVLENLVTAWITRKKTSL